MRNFLLLIVCMLSFQITVFAQYNLKENNVWAFGLRGGLDFNSGSPVPIKTGMSSGGTNAAPEGCTSVSDANGQLLFYTMGDTIWNKNHEAMANGFNLLPVPAGTKCTVAKFGVNNAATASTTQGVLIIPVIDDPNKYYVFCLQSICALDTKAGRLFYSMVDMTLNNGLGDVVTGTKGIKIDSFLSEKMISIPGDNCDMWLLTHGKQNDTFKAYNITAAGINFTPVLSAAGTISGAAAYSIGTLKVSPNRRKLALGSTGNLGVGGVGGELCDFDPATGKVSNAVNITSNLVYGIGFSPDNSKLYFNQVYRDAGTGNTDLYLAQYDISLSTTSAIINSRVNLMTQLGSAQIKDMRLAPDGKMYMMAGIMGLQESDSMDVIDYPNLAGTASHYVHNAFALATGTKIGQGICNMYNKPLRDTIYAKVDTNLIASPSLSFQIPSGYFSYLWNDGDTSSSKTITQLGTYWVAYGNYCTYRVDTFIVAAPPPPPPPPGGIATVNSTAAMAMTAYPNPAYNKVTVVINSKTVSGKLRITDAVGRVQLQQVIDKPTQTIDVSNFTSGIYNVEYFDDNTMHSHCRIVVAK